MNWLTTFVGLILLFVAYHYAAVFIIHKIRHRKQPPGTKVPPGPLSLPIIKSMGEHVKYKGNILDFFDGNVAKFGTCFQFEGVEGPFYIFGEPACAEHMLKTKFHNYPKGPHVCELLHDLLGNGIFAVDGDMWKSQRKTFSHLFKVANMKTLMYDTFVKHGKEVMDILEKHSNSGQEIEVQQLFYRFTLDSIGDIAFGKGIGALHQDTPFSKAFDVALNRTESRVKSLFWKYLPDSKMREALKVLDDYVYAMIEERRRDPNLQDLHDLLSSYIKNTTENNTYLRDIVVSFMIAGRDTTGQTLTWMFYLLASNPDVEAELLKEIDSLNGVTPTYDTFKRMPYLEGVVNETLRLYPPVPSDAKYCLEDDVFPNGVFVPKGTNVIWNAWIMGRHEKYWKQPLVMDPTRWAEGKTPTEHPFTFIPFQAGPRICLGQAMALLEVKLCAVTILQKYRLKLVPGQTVKPVYNITINTSDGCRMTVEKRPSL